MINKKVYISLLYLTLRTDIPLKKSKHYPNQQTKNLLFVPAGLFRSRSTATVQDLVFTQTPISNASRRY